MALFNEAAVAIRADIDIEKTFDSFHAYAVPVGIDIRPGDVVFIHGVPTDIGFGERLVMQCDATVHRAGVLKRLWTRASSMFELTDLYEVGFEPKGAS